MPSVLRVANTDFLRAYNPSLRYGPFEHFFHFIVQGFIELLVAEGRALDAEEVGAGGLGVGHRELLVQSQALGLQGTRQIKRNYPLSENVR